MEKFLKWLILLLIVLMVIILFYSNVRAESDWKLSANIYKAVAADPESIVQSGAGVQVSLHRKSLYLYLSKDVNQVRFAGQGGPDISLWSAGIGMQRTVGEYLTLSLDAGWYEPIFEDMGEPEPYYSSPFAEGLCRYLNNFLMPTNQEQPYIPAWNYYTLEYHAGMGGKLNLAFEYPVTEKISLDMAAGYRYLKLLEHITGQDYDGGYSRLGEDGCWTIRHERDFSAWMIGGALTFKF